MTKASKIKRSGKVLTVRQDLIKPKISRDVSDPSVQSRRDIVKQVSEFDKKLNELHQRYKKTSKPQMNNIIPHTDISVISLALPTLNIFCEHNSVSNESLKNLSLGTNDTQNPLSIIDSLLPDEIPTNNHQNSHKILKAKILSHGKFSVLENDMSDTLIETDIKLGPAILRLHP